MNKQTFVKLDSQIKLQTIRERLTYANKQVELHEQDDQLSGRESGADEWSGCNDGGEVGVVRGSCS